MEASKNLLGLKAAWALQEEAFQSNLPLNNNKMSRKHTFDRGSMATVFHLLMLKLVIIWEFQ